MWNELIDQCAQTLALLAPADFARARDAATKFRRVEARTAAQLARQVLETLGPAQRPKGPMHGPPIIKRNE